MADPFNEYDARKRLLWLIDVLRTEINIEVRKELLDSVTKPGENWVGEIYSVKSYRTGTKEELPLIIKWAPLDLSYRKLLNVAPLFDREIYFYDKVIPEVIAIQHDRCIKDMYKLFVKHYFSSKQYLKEVIVMEDMRAKGFIVGNHRKPIDYETALLVMKTLGKFHALSFALREYKPDVFNEICANCQDNFLTTPAVNNMLMQVYPNLSKQIWATCSASDEQIRVALKKSADNLPSTFSGILQCQEHQDYGVITHGDPQIRNFLFKYGTGSKSMIPEECCMIDMQLGRIGSPTLDILFFMFVNTDRDFRRNHYKNLIDEYYRNFSEFSRYLGCDPDAIFPFNVLQSHLRKFAPFGLVWAIWVVGSNLKQPSDAPRKDKLSEELLIKIFTTVTDKRYFTRIKDLVVDMLEYGYEFC